ncbi:MAG: ATP-dependent helicase [Candidatus Coatesbacteria bacterium]|nr:MAG: ATP-dependent helicase [Candidatus Coatesbacteria bacterium]
MDVERIINILKTQLEDEEQIVDYRVIPPRSARYSDIKLKPQICSCLERVGIQRFYFHQAKAIESILSGLNTLIATPTASGKTITYTIPTLNALLEDRRSTFLYLFPTKALAQDQLRSINELVLGDMELTQILRAFTYDGDTPQDQRKSIREMGNVIISNPDMLHSGILPHHTRWARVFTNLKYIVIDEVHVYRGVFGSNVTNVIKRLKRICSHYGSEPVFILSSATIGNPQDLAVRLIDDEVVAIGDDGSPSGERHILFWQPRMIDRRRNLRRSANIEARDILYHLIREGVQTIVFAQARVVAELVYRYTHQKLVEKGDVELARRISPYRGGYLPEERREIEKQLFEGEILGVISTNALELGIDIGSLDCSIIVGYPGSIASLWQQAGRAGRGSESALTIYIPYNNPLDQFLASNPHYVYDSPFESAIIDPTNPNILLAHLRCAAYELPIRDDDIELFNGVSSTIVNMLVNKGEMVDTGDAIHFSVEGYPSSGVSLRTASGNTFNIVDVEGNRVIGTVDEESALEVVYPEAIYLHSGDTYFVRELDLRQKVAFVENRNVEYYTQADVETTIKLIETKYREDRGLYELGFGDVKTTTQTVGFKKIRFSNLESIGWGGLDLPKRSMDTEAVFFIASKELINKMRNEGYNIYEALVGFKNSLLSVSCLFVMCDSGDISGVVESNNFGSPTIFIFDRFMGGLGFSEKIYKSFMDVLIAVNDLIGKCECDEGCPKCVGVSSRTYSRHYDPDLSNTPLIPSKHATLKFTELIIGE